MALDLNENTEMPLKIFHKSQSIIFSKNKNVTDLKRKKENRSSFFTFEGFSLKLLKINMNIQPVSLNHTESQFTKALDLGKVL